MGDDSGAHAGGRSASRDDDEAYDRLRRRVLWSMPSGLYLIGSAAHGEANLMTANWATQVASEPKLVGVSVEVGALTHRLIEDGRAFSVNVVARGERAVVRRFVKPAVWDPEASTLNGFAVRTALSGAPVFVGAAGWLDCRLVQASALGSHTLFVGEVVDCGQDPQEGTEAVPVLRMEDTRMNYGG
jgi:flavin reductase (DIM6/NTAB) family NADH-FMN oxidoreductase RutF